MGGGARSPLQQCASADSSAAAVMKHESAPHPPCRAPSPRRNGEKGLHAHSPACSRAFLRQRQLSLRPAQRGEGGAAAPDEGPWEVGCDRRFSRARALLHRLLHEKQKSAPHPRLPPHLLPVATGRRDQHALSPACSRAFLRRRQPSLRPAPAGRRCPAGRMRGALLFCVRHAPARARQRQRPAGEGGSRRRAADGGAGAADGAALDCF